MNQPRQGATVVSTHQQVPMDFAIRGNRILQQDTAFASFYSPKRRLADNANLLTS
ncbi:unnamed protein product, partial [Aphanomyces euteiches]